MEQNGYSYVARCPRYGVIYAAATCDPTRRRDVALHVAEWIREGGIVDRVPDSEVRLGFGACKKNCLKCDGFDMSEPTQEPLL